MPKEKYILIVDDAPLNRAMLRKILSEQYMVLDAENGVAALELLSKYKGRICMIMLDLIMPVMDGYEFLRRVTVMPEYKSIPVVVTTASMERNNELRALELGARDVIAKPYDVQVLYRRVQNLIAQTDVENERAENDMHKMNTEFGALMDAINDGAAAFKDLQSPAPLYFNDALARMTGYSREELKVMFSGGIEGIIEPQDRTLASNAVAKAERDGVAISCSFRYIRKDGGSGWVNMMAKKIRGGGGAMFYAVFMDISKEKLSETKVEEMLRQLKYDSEHDRLTGIYNRRNFYDKTIEMLRQNPKTNYTLVCWNIVRFKVINDLFGMKTGDMILRRISENLRNIVCGYGTYGRLEADHFVMCVPSGYLSPDELVERTDKSFRQCGLDYNIVSCFGIYNIDDVTLPIDQMCDRAALALQEIKGNYMQRYAVYNETLRAAVLEEQEIESEMNSALDGGQFCVYFQPIYSSSTELPVSAEALVRWNHPEKGFVSPSTFIKLFERNGFITKLDMYVWELVCKFIRYEEDRGHPTIPISVNISRIDFYNSGLCDVLIALVEKYEISPSFLKLEITESAYTDNPVQLLDAMRQLQRYGFQILMDDFGSGYSSLNMIKDVPVDILKIDMRFISDLSTSERAGSVMNSVVRMAKWLEMDVVAEGVETKEQLDFLRSIGCDSIQGYYYSRPLPQDEFIELLANAEASTGKESQDLMINDTAIDEIWKLINNPHTFLNDMVGGIGLYELGEDDLEIVRVNDSYYEMTGSTPQTLFRDTKSAFSWVYEQDREKLLQKCKDAELSGKTEKLCIRRYNQAAKLLWLNIRMRYVGKKGARRIYCFFIADVTELHTDEAAPVRRETNTESRAEKLLILHENTAPKPRKVIVIDDNQINRIMLRKMLSDRYEVLEAENGKSGLELIKMQSADIAAILLDIVMPVMDGYEFMRARRDDSALSVIPVIVLSQAESRKNEIRALELGASDFVKKPYEPDIIRQRLANLIQLRETLENRSTAEAILDNLPVGIGVYDIRDADRTLRYASRGLAELLGYTVDEYLAKLKGDAYADLCPEDAAIFKREERRTIAEHREMVLEYRAFSKVGDVHWLRIVAKYVYTDGDDTVYYAAVTNIDAQKRMERMLARRTAEQRKQCEYVENMCRTVPCGILQLTLDYNPRPISANKMAVEALGFNNEQECLEEYQGGIGNAIFAEDLPAAKESIKQLLIFGGTQHCLMRLYKKNGELIWVRCIMKRAETMDGQDILQGVFLDATEQMEREILLKKQKNELLAANRKYGIAVEQSRIRIWEYDIKRDILKFSPEIAKILNCGAEINFAREFVKKHCRLSDEDASKAVAIMDGLQGGEARAEQIITGCGAPTNKNKAWKQVSYVTIYDEDGNPDTAIGIAKDVTEEIKSRRQYEREAAYRRSLIGKTAFFMEFDIVTGKIVSMSAGLSPEFGDAATITMSELYASLSTKALYPDDMDEWARFDIIKLTRETIVSDENDMSMEIRMRSLTGNYDGYHWCAITASHIVNPETGHPHVFICVRDIDSRKCEELMLRRNAQIDSLTGLLNRASFEKFATKAMEDGANGAAKFAFIIIDLDDFKGINDSYGHVYGDEVLKESAARLRCMFRENDMITRMGGDELAVFMTNIPSEELAARKGMEVCRVLNGAHDEDRTPLTCSVGVAVSPQHGSTFETLYHNADLALYQAKRQGKNQCRMYNSKAIVPRMAIYEKLWAVRSCYDDSPSAFCVMELERGESNNTFKMALRYINDALAKLSGKSVRGMQGKTFAELFGENNDEVNRCCGEIAYGANSRTMELRSSNGKSVNIQCYQMLEGYCACVVTESAVS